MYQTFGKRSLDVVLTSFALVWLSFFLAVIALSVRVKLGAPVIFRQLRPGLHGQPFVVFKFRTMNDARDEQGNLLPDSHRLTSFGRFLRSTSLDEFPELVNVLRGEMSLVGPRPLLMRYLDRYTSEQRRRQDVRPGITGWAQINGRNAISWEERFTLDVWYVDHVSLWLDLKTLIVTTLAVLRRKGINAPGQATIQEFMGSRSVPQVQPDARKIGAE